MRAQGKPPRYSRRTQRGRALREEGGDSDARARTVRERRGRGRRGLQRGSGGTGRWLAGLACGVRRGESWGAHAGPACVAGRAGDGGPGGWKQMGCGKERRWVGPVGLGWCWVDFGCGFVFYFSLLFLNKSNLIEFKPNLNSNPMHSTKQIKLMHQHECNTKI